MTKLVNCLCYCLSSVLCFTFAHLETRQRLVLCEPTTALLDSKFWLRKYPFTKSNIGFNIAVAKLSSRTFPNETVGVIETAIHQNIVRSYHVSLVLYQTEHIYSPRKISYTIMFNFLSGDTAVIHVFNPNTKTYARNELGFHSRKYFLVVEAGHYFSVDIAKHRDERYCFLGMPIIRGLAKESTPKDVILEEFPEQEELINKLYTNVGYIRT